MLFGVNETVQIDALAGVDMNPPEGGDMAELADQADQLRPWFNRETNKQRRNVLMNLVRDFDELAVLFAQSGESVTIRTRCKLYCGLIHLVWTLTPNRSTVHTIIKDVKTPLDVSIHPAAFNLARFFVFYLSHFFK